MQRHWTQSMPIGGLSSARLPPGLREAEEQNCYGELGLALNKTNPQADKNELRKVVFEYLRYPSIDLAELHSECNRLGSLDVIDNEGDPLQGMALQSDQLKVCNCCGFKRQPESIPLSLPLDGVSGLGSSTILLFEAMKNCMWMLMLAGAIYSFYSVWSSAALAGESCPSFLKCSVVAISLHSKTIKGAAEGWAYKLQSWLAVVLVVIWGLWFLWMNYRKRKIEVLTDLMTASASDFTIMIENLSAEIDEPTFQTILNHYQQDIDPDGQMDPLQIVRFNIAEPFYVDEDDMKDQQLKSLKAQRKHLQEILRGWLRARSQKDSFQQPQEERFQLYRRFQQLNDKIKDRVNQIAHKLKQRYLSNRKTLPTNTVFVTFRYSASQHLVVNNNQSSLERLRAYLMCRGFGKLRLPLSGITVARAPEPEDVLFANVGVPKEKILFRKMLTFLAATLIVSLTFGISFFLKQTRLKQHSNRALSFLISAVITIVNIYLAVAIRKLTAFEKNPTRIHTQRSHAVKSVVSQIANMVVVPLLQCVVIQSNLYGKGGLAQVVFHLAITNALLAPLLKLINTGTLYRLWKKWYLNRPQKKLYLTQNELNLLFEGKPFEVGREYIYAIKTIVFTSFYMSLQPVIVPISLIGIVFMYWVNKYILLVRSQRPPPGTDIVHNTLSQFIYLCPFLFCVGGIAWPFFNNQQMPTHPYFIGAVISLLLYLLPLEEIFQSLVKNTHDNMVYQEQRIKFTSEYDRCNPATRKRASIEYRKFLEDYQNKISGDELKPTPQKQRILRLIKRDLNQRSLAITSYVSQFENNSPNEFENILLMFNNDSSQPDTHQQSPTPQKQPSYGQQPFLQQPPGWGWGQYPADGSNTQLHWRY